MNGTLVVSIGRGMGRIQGGPLSTPDWRQFKSEVRGLVCANLATLLVFDGSGIGDNGEGQAEDSHTVIVTNFYDGDLLSLTPALSRLAGRYQQNSIAVTFGQTQFVTPEV